MGSSGSSANAEGSRSSSLWFLALLSLALLAYFWTVVVGARGFFPIDQSVVYDGAWRVLNGQTPYADFFFHHGLVTIWIQAFLFKLFGASFSVYLMGAALLNALASLLAVRIVLQILPSSRRFALLAGLLTAIWYHPPFGTPFSEQTAFFFCFLALTCALSVSRQGSPLAKKLWLALTGFVLFVAFLSKQNAGAFFLPVLAVVVALDSPRKLRAWLSRLLVMGTGFMAASLLFAGWLILYSDWAQFLESCFLIPSGKLMPRLREHFPENLLWLIIGKGHAVARSILVALLFVCGLFAYRFRALLRSDEASERRQFDAAVLAVLLVLYQNGYNLITNQSVENGYPFIGLICAFCFACLPTVLKGLKGVKSISLSIDNPFMRIALPAILVVVLAGRGIKVAYARRIHDVFKGADFSEHLKVGGFEALRWAKPSKFGGDDIKASDVEALVAHLKQRDQNFFVFPDFTFLYAAVGKVSQQPVLFWWKGISYPIIYDQGLDERVVRSLKDSDVRIIVIEEPSWEAGRLDDFPLLKAFIQGEFADAHRFGTLRVLEKR